MRTLLVLALLVAFAPAAGTPARAAGPTLKVSSVSQEIVAWCLPTGFFYANDFGPSGAAAGPDYATVLLAPSQGIIATESGEVDLDDCVGLGTVMQAYKKGAHNSVIVAVTGEIPAYSMIGSKNVKKLADLRGKAIASNGLQTTATQAVVAILQRGANMLPDRDYALVAAGNAGARAAALAAGKIDGVTTVAPFTYKMLDDGFPLLAAEKQYVPNYVQGTLVVNRGWAEKNRPVLVAVLKRMLEVGRWLHDPKQKTDVLAKMAADVTMGTVKMGPEYARRMYDDTVAQPGGVVDGGFADAALFARTFELLQERGIIEKADVPPLDRIVDFSYLNEARRQLGLPAVKL